MEQVARFEEVTWETILRALGKEGNLNLDSATIPSKYACDSRDLGNHSLAQPLGAALLQEDSEMERRLIMSRALQRSVESSHRILDSVFWNSSQHQLDSVAEQLDSVWRPICDELGCDSSNYLDVFLTSHRQSAMLLQTNMAAHLRNEIKQRMKLERKVQEVIAGRDAQKFWRPDDYQDASVESFHAYHAKGRAGIEHMLKRARKLGVDKMMLLVNQVDMAFHKRPLEQAFDHEVSNLSLAAVESGDFWDDLAKVFDCIGYGARFTSTGYSYSFNDYVSLALGLSAGDSASLRGLIEMQELTDLSEGRRGLGLDLRGFCGWSMHRYILGRSSGIDDCELWLRISKTLSDRWIHCRSTLQVVQSVGLSFWADLLWMAKYQMLTVSM